MDDEVAGYLEKQPSPQREICEQLRQIILKTFPDMNESFKNGVPWYEDKYYIVGLKDHVNIGFSIKALNANELKLLEGNGKLMRHIKVHSLDEIDELQIIKLLKIINEK